MSCGVFYFQSAGECSADFCLFVYFVYFVVHPLLNVRTAIFAVLNGSPLQSVHALPSTLSSLFSTSYLPHSFCDYYSVWLGRGCRGVDFRIIRPSVRATLIFQED